MNESLSALPFALFISLGITFAAITREIIVRFLLNQQKQITCLITVYRLCKSVCVDLKIPDEGRLLKHYDQIVEALSYLRSGSNEYYLASYTLDSIDLCRRSRFNDHNDIDRICQHIEMKVLEIEKEDALPSIRKKRRRLSLIVFLLGLPRGDRGDKEILRSEANVEGGAAGGASEKKGYPPVQEA